MWRHGVVDEDDDIVVDFNDIISHWQRFADVTITWQANALHHDKTTQAFQHAQVNDKSHIPGDIDEQCPVTT